MIYVDFRTHPDLPWISYFYILIKAGIISKLYRKRWSGTFLRIYNAMVHLRSIKMIKGSLQNNILVSARSGSGLLFPVLNWVLLHISQLFFLAPVLTPAWCPLLLDIRLAGSRCKQNVFTIYQRNIMWKTMCLSEEFLKDISFNFQLMNSATQSSRLNGWINWVWTGWVWLINFLSWSVIPSYVRSW